MSGDWLILCMSTAVFVCISSVASNEEVPTNENDDFKSKYSTNPFPIDFYKDKGPTINPGLKSDKVSFYKKAFNDPFWNNMWYVQDYRTAEMPVMDLNVVPVYAQGITGKDIKVAVIEHSANYNHPDLAPNYLRDLSIDVAKNIPLILDGKESYDDLSHGTFSASIISMVANNTNCGVGIAYNSKVAVVRVGEEGQPLSDYIRAMGYIPHLYQFDIINNSWGTSDNGKVMERDPGFVELATIFGARKGRKGKGLIYTVAAGNGGNEDHCGADYFVNLEVTMAISAASQFGKKTLYNEQCSAIFATTYGGDFKDEEHLVAASPVDSSCVTAANGTSAATPVASAILALVLEANPDLTYRDMMHITTMGAEVAPLADNAKTWNKNGMGFWVSHYFGFGLMNAENMVKLAKGWVTVPEKRTCHFNIKFDENVTLKYRETLKMTFFTDSCKGTDNEVNYLESFEVHSTIKYPRRGGLIISAISPEGTKSVLLGRRMRDYDTEGLKGWPIKSVHSWGESPRGYWTIEVYAHYKPDGWFDFGKPTGSIEEFTVKLHGTKEAPKHYENLPRRTYAGFKLPDGRSSEARERKKKIVCDGETCRATFVEV